MATQVLTGPVHRPEISDEEARKFAGRWVALRSGRVVASAKSERHLLKNAQVRPTDGIYFVPRSETVYY